jgi:hypothetical protein
MTGVPGHKKGWKRGDPPRKNRVVVGFTDADYERLITREQSTGTSRGDIIRVAVDRYLEQQSA